MRWYPAYVGLGSNLEAPAIQIEQALERLARVPDSRLVRRSSLFGSKPMDSSAQPDFVNAAAALLTQLDADAFFDALRGLERSLGRRPSAVRWGPRVIDLDLLVFADLSQQREDLQLPHPGIAGRNFVLYPLAEIAPDLVVPGAGRVSELAARVSPAGIWRIEAPPVAS